MLTPPIQSLTSLVQDTIVRYSAAKGVARIAERLPSDLAQQVLETVMGLFDIHSIAAASLYDLPSLAEGTWHGACLACAEMARRGLVSPTSLPSLINWLSKAGNIRARGCSLTHQSPYRPSTSIFGKVLTQSDRMFVMLQPMCFGLWLGPRMLPTLRLMPTILHVASLQCLCSIVRYISVGLLVPHSRSMSAER